MDYDDFVILMISIACFVFGMAVGVMLFIVTTAGHVHAQTAENITSAEVSANPNLKFVPQPAYVSIGNPNDPNSAVTQTQSNSRGTGDVILSVILSLIGVVAAKFHSDNKTSKLNNIVKGNMGEMLKDKNIRDELAKLLYQFNPEKAAALTDSPDLKLENLKENTQEFADKAAKS